MSKLNTGDKVTRHDRQRVWVQIGDDEEPQWRDRLWPEEDYFPTAGKMWWENGGPHDDDGTLLCRITTLSRYVWCFKLKLCETYNAISELMWVAVLPKYEDLKKKWLFNETVLILRLKENLAMKKCGLHKDPVTVNCLFFFVGKISRYQTFFIYLQVYEFTNKRCEL